MKNKDMDKMRDKIEKFKNQLMNLWKVSVPYPVTVLCFQNELANYITELLEAKDREILDVAKKAIDDVFNEGKLQIKQLQAKLKDYEENYIAKEEHEKLRKLSLGEYKKFTEQYKFDGVMEAIRSGDLIAKDKLLSEGELLKIGKDTMRTMLDEVDDWNCDLLVELVAKALKQAQEDKK